MVLPSRSTIRPLMAPTRWKVGFDRARLHLRAELADVLNLLGEHVVVELVVRNLEHALGAAAWGGSLRARRVGSD